MAEETDVFKAVEAVFIADGGLSGLSALCPGGINFEFAPEGTVAPRVVYEDEGTQGSFRTYAGKTFKQNLVFKIYATDGDILAQIINRLDDVYTGNILTLPSGLVSGAGHIKLDEIRRYKQKEPKRDEGFDFVYIAEVPYETTVNQ